MGDIVLMKPKAERSKPQHSNPTGGGNSGGGDMETRVAKLEQNIGEIKTDIAVIKTRLDQLEKNTATKADLAELKAEFRASMADLKTAIADTKSDLMRWTITTLIAGIGVASAVVFGIARFVPSQPPQIYLQAPAQPGPAIPIPPKTNPPASP